MNRFGFLFYIGFSVFVSSCATTGIQNESFSDRTDIVRWSDTTKLSWEDFTGTPPDNTTLDFEMVVLTPAEFQEPSIFRSASAKVECYMVKDASWVIKSKEKKQLLAYNQIMFDICELSARKLRKAISEADFELLGSSELFNKIYNDNKRELTNTIDSYHSETESGINTKKLKEWQEKVVRELSILEDFKIE
ncbi:MAG: hypothetical protein JXA06_04845 [Bacteroidetes bacterium]|nr:hypothetical protein [Bacteroidota bacterium]